MLENTPLLIDSHCHLNSDFSPKSADDLVREAHESGVEYLITIATDGPRLPEVIAIAEKHERVFFAAGVHPHEAAEFDFERDLKAVREASSHEKCRAIGELGLDYYYDHSPKEIQIQVLQTQLDLALETQLPVVIHSRDAEDDLLPLLEEYAKKVPKSRSPGVIHCFTGTERFGSACLDLGFYISFSGIITFKNAEDLREAARKFPLERILVETDSPYLAPVPMRGKKCEPIMVRHTALRLAEIKGVSFETLAEQTTANSKRLFRLPS